MTDAGLAKGCHRKQKAAEIKGSSVYKLIKTEFIEHPYRLFPPEEDVENDGDAEDGGKGIDGQQASFGGKCAQQHTK